MINAQEWLDQNYPTGERKNIINLNVKEKELESHLDLSEFKNLKKLNCDQNKITKLDVRKCSKLEELNCHSNRYLIELVLPDNRENLKVVNVGCCCQLPKKDLTFFQEFTNLKKLSLSNTNFYGTLEPLKNMNKLKELIVSHTDISEGLEYLPESIEWLFCCGSGHDDSCYQVKKIQEQLEPFKFLVSGNEYYQYNWKAWRRFRLFQLTKDKKALEDKLTKQKEISQKLINHLKEENQNLEACLREERIIYQNQIAIQQNKLKELEGVNQQLQNKTSTSSWAKVASANSFSWNQNSQSTPVWPRDSLQEQEEEDFIVRRERKFFISLFKDLLGSRETIQWDNKESWKEQVERLKSTLASLKGDNHKYKKKLEEFIFINENLEKNNKGMSRRLNFSQEQNEELQIQLADEKSQSIENIVELEAAKKEINNLQKQLKIANAKTVVSQKTKDKSNKGQKAEQLQEKLKDREKEIEELEKQLNNLKLKEIQIQSHQEIPPKQ